MRVRRVPTGALAALALLATLGIGAAPAEPTARGIHVALGSDARTTATVAWYTTGSVDPGTAVEYGSSSDALSDQVAGTSQPGHEVDVVLHEARLDGLSPGQTVWYRVGDGTSWSAVRSFRTAPGNDDFTFTLFSDHGMTAQSRATTAAVLAEEPDLHLMAGDLSYANGHVALWNEWFDQIEPLASTVPLMVAPGNHETEEGPPGDTSATFRSRFALPGEELYYSFDYGRVHFLVLHSTLTPAKEEGVYETELAFAEEDLRSAWQRRRAGELDFVIVMQHHPLYGNNEGTGQLGVVPTSRQFNSELVAREEHILQRYDVDVLIAAHNHHYERSKPVAYTVPTTDEERAYTDPIGFVEVISGGGGQSLYSFRDPNDVWSFSAARAKRFHYVRFDVSGRTLTATAIATDPEPGEAQPVVLDTWSITRA